MTPRRSLPTMLAALAGAALLAGLAWAAAQGAAAPPPGHARAAPLAAKNLLLAGTQIKTAAGSRLVAVGEYGHVLLSDDQGRSWRQARSVPTVTTLTALHFIDDRQGWAVGHGGVVIGTLDGGETWQPLAGRLDGKEVLLSVWFKDALQGLVVGAFGYAARSADGGKSWTPVELAAGEDGERHLNQIFTGPAINGQPGLWVAAENGVLFRSDDGGGRWQTVELPYKGSVWGGRLLADGALLVWGMRGHVLRSDDGGKTFAELDTGTDQSLGGGVQSGDGTVVLAGLGGAVLHSRDGGRHFTPTVRDDRASLTAVLPGPAGQVVLLGQSGALLQPVGAAASAPK
jgi:photosystem II stability/assembly factor-like uncharacterized protein